MPQPPGKSFDRIDEAMITRAWRVARALTRSADDADDLMQQAFIVAWRNRDSIPPHTWPWFVTVVRNCWRNEVRKNARTRTMEDIDDYLDSSALPAPDSIAEQHDLNEALHGAMLTLPEDEREAVTMCFIGGLTHEQAGLASGVNINTIKSRVSRGLERLRRKMHPRAGSPANYVAAIAFPVPSGGFAASIARWKDGAVGGVSPFPWPAPGPALGVVAACVAIAGCVLLFTSYGLASETAAPGPVELPPGATHNTTRGTDVASDQENGLDFIGNRPHARDKVQPGQLAPDETQRGKERAAGDDPRMVRSDPDPVTGLITLTRFYYPGGPIEFRWTVKPGGADVMHGPYTRYHMNGQLADVGQHEDGKETGEWTSYHANGQKSAVGRYVNNLQVGTWTFWNENGHRSSEGTFVDGRREGTWTTWGDTGVIKELNRSRNGKMEGWQILYDAQGRKEAAQLWKNGRRSGERVTLENGDDSKLPDPDAIRGE